MLSSDDSPTKSRNSTLIESAISLYTPSGQEGPIARLIFDELRSLGLEPMIDAAGNVICSAGTGSRSLLLCGHMDTVPGKLPVTKKGDLIFGRGACDAKGPLLSLLFAFEEFVKSPLKGLGRIIFAGVTEEERTSAGLKELFKNNVKADYAIFGEPGGLSKITVAYRGHLPTKIFVETSEAHASAPWLATNSAELAFAIYKTLKEETWDRTSDRLVEEISVTLTGIHGESSHNITPLRTELTLDIRLPLKLSVDSAIATIELVIEKFRKENASAKIRAEYDDPTEAYRTKLDSTLVRAMTRSMLKSRWHLKPSFIQKSATGDMNSYASHFKVEALTFGPGDTKLSHTSQEVVSIREIFDCSEIILGTAEELFQMKSA